MNSVRRQQINDLADQIRNICKIGVPTSTNDLKRAIELLGGEYEERNNLDYEASIEKTDVNRFKIIISSDFMPTRRKFSIAHEIGHLFLHMGFLIDDENWKTWNTKLFRDSARDRLGRSEAESEANEFAGALLMPKQEFERVASETVERINGNDFYQVDKIAEHFEVSLQAALTRGRWLQLFPWE